MISQRDDKRKPNQNTGEENSWLPEFIFETVPHSPDSVLFYPFLMESQIDPFFTNGWPRDRVKPINPLTQAEIFSENMADSAPCSHLLWEYSTLPAPLEMPKELENIYTYPIHTSMAYVCVYIHIPGGSAGKESTCNAGPTGDAGLIPELESSPGGRHATNSSILAWRIPWTEESDGLQSMGSQRAGHDWRDLAYM